MQKQYIGDGVYVELVTHPMVGLIVTTENGVEVTNRIYLDADVWMNLTSYVRMMTNGKDKVQA